jgi:hypothetical protein
VNCEVGSQIDEVFEREKSEPQIYILEDEVLGAVTASRDSPESSWSEWSCI